MSKERLRLRQILLDFKVQKFQHLANPKNDTLQTKHKEIKLNSW